jgi:hypothetical protein
MVKNKLNKESNLSPVIIIIYLEYYEDNDMISS